MKSKINPIALSVLIIALGALVFFLLGCGTAGGLYTRTPVVTTNLFPVVIPPPSPDLPAVTNWETRVTTNYSYALSPETQQGIDTGQTVSTLIPPPYGDAVAGGISIVAAILAYVARIKSRDAASAQNQLIAVVRGVEKSASNPIGGEVVRSYVKPAIAQQATLLGSETVSALHQTVKEET